jgi:NifU-like protein involved in Fe-S cluster formation
MEPQSPYSSRVVEYFSHTPNAGIPAGDEPNLFSGSAGNREHGTEIVFHMRVQDGSVDAMGFQVFGCPHTIAACCLATEMLTGRPAGALTELTPESLCTALEVPVEKKGRILVLQDALRNCFMAWDNRRLG